MQSLVGPNDFPASRKCTYLNAASVALMYGGAEQAVTEWQRDIAENGTINFDEKAEESVFSDLHSSAARLLNARPEDIAVGSSATELLASLAWAVAPGPGTNIVSTDIAFPSTVYPWSRVAKYSGAEVRLCRSENEYARFDDVARLIDDRTAVVCVSHVEYSGGQLHDLAKLAEVAHAIGALLVVDATQSAGAIPIDVSVSGVDALVSAGYKWLCGPFGVAVLYLAPELQNRLEPGVVGFRSHKKMWDLRPDRIEYPETARRFEYSTMAYGCAIGLTRSIDYLVKVGVERIFERNMRLMDRLVEGLRERDAAVVSSLEEHERTSIIAVRFPGKDSEALAKHLNQVRVVVSQRRGLVRFSAHLYNEPGDIEQALEKIDCFSG